MSLLRDRMMRDMERAGLAPRTRYRYIRAVRLLAKFHGRSPDLLTAEEIMAWDDDLVRRGLSPICRIVYMSAAAFLFRKTLQRPEVVSFFVRPKVRRRLPTVLSPEEVGRLLALVREPRYRAFFSLLYDTGLRISEAVALTVGDIDRSRGVIRVREGTIRTANRAEWPVGPLPGRSPEGQRPEPRAGKTARSSWGTACTRSCAPIGGRSG